MQFFLSTIILSLLASAATAQDDNNPSSSSCAWAFPDATAQAMLAAGAMGSSSSCVTYPSSMISTVKSTTITIDCSGCSSTSFSLPTSGTGNGQNGENQENQENEKRQAGGGSTCQTASQTFLYTPYACSSDGSNVRARAVPVATTA